MNAVEKLQAAIDKLEALKVSSTPGVWSGEESGVGFQFEIRDNFAVGYVALDSELRPSDADLIVTLHRTIDAQLGILRGAHRLLATRRALGNYTLYPYDRELALADAILGEE